MVTPNCVIYIDRHEFATKEPIYVVFVNLGPATLYLGSWHVVDEKGNTIFSMEPPQIAIPPSTSYTIVWFQQDNEGKLVSKGKYRIIWRPKLNSQLISCYSDYFEIV